MEPNSKKSKTEFKINYVYHIADIHIHYKNYEHIKHAWRQLVCDMLTQLSESVLVIAGDIFDHKTYLKAEDIQLFNDMMNDLETNHIHCIMIPGNHDYNNNLLDNKENGDMIKALVQKANYNYIHYFSLSQIYQFHNIMFYLHSPIDLKVLEPIQDSSLIHIAVLHEAIQGSKTVSGHTFDTCRFSSEYLSSKFNIALLGDIHLMQFLKPNVAYPGSFVQKNRTEDLSKGYILWSLGSLTAQFNPLNQLSVWFKVSIEKDQASLTLPSTDITVRGFQLHHKQCSEKFIHYYKEFLETRYHCRLDGVYNNDILSSSSVANLNELIPVTVNDIESIIMEDLTKIPNANKERIMALHTSLFEKIQGAPSVNWKIKFMSWSGIKKYSKKTSYINFDDLSTLSSLIGRNEIGKSTVFDILILLLFNQASSKKNIINKFENEAWAKCIIQVGSSDIYTIERCWWGSENQTRVKLLYNDQDITKTTLNETYKYLESNITGSFIVFKDVIIAMQERKSIVNIPKNECYDLFCRIMDLERLKVAEKENHTLLAKCKKDMIKYKSMGCSNEEMIKLKFEKDQLDQKYDETKKQMEDKQNRSTLVYNEIQKLHPIIYSCQYDIDFITTKLDELEPFKDFDCNHHELLLKELAHKKSMLWEMEKLKPDEEDRTIDFDDCLKTYMNLSFKYEKTLENHNKLIELETKLKKATPLHTYGFEFNSTCNSCIKNQNIINTHSKLPRLEDIIIEIQNQSIELKNTKIQVDKLKNVLDCMNNGFNKHQYELWKEEISQLTNTINDEARSFKYCQEYYKFHGLIEQSTIASKAKKELLDLQNVLKELNNNTNIESLLHTKYQLDHKIETFIKNNEEVEKYEIEYTDREIYDKLINSKTGLPFKMMESITKKVETNCNLIFSSIANFRIQIKYTTKGIKLFIVELRGSTTITIPAQQGSGYDKFIIDIILRNVLCSLVTAGLPSMLFIDEGFGSADENHFQIICGQVLPALAKHFNRIIVVSHLIEIHNYTHSFIEIISDENNNSNLIYGSIPNNNWIHCDILDQKKVMQIEKKKPKEIVLINDPNFEKMDETMTRCLVCHKEFKTSYLNNHKKTKIHETKLNNLTGIQFEFGE